MNSINEVATKPLISLSAGLGSRPLLRQFVQPLIPALENLLGVRDLNRIHAEASHAYQMEQGASSFMDVTLARMGVTYSTSEESLLSIPVEGPLIVLANHPYGGVDGLILGSLLQRVRPDVKLMGNYLLGRIEGMRSHLIEVDPFESEGSAQANLSGMRQAVRHLRNGGCLVAFPAGEVSSFHWKTGSVVDRPWTSHLAQLAIRTQANVLPLYFEGRNSNFFQTMGCVHPRLRTLLLAREFCAMQGKKVGVQVGRPIRYDRLERFENAESATQYLRLKTYALSSTGRLRTKMGVRSGAAHGGSADKLEPLAPEQPRELIAAEIAGLDTSCRLVVHGQFSVYIASAEQIPVTLQQIGRLREETFRAVDEGTGLALDLDDYDQSYQHLFLWDAEAEAIVGAYRIGLTDQLLQAAGRNGLYTHTLFHFRQDFLEQLGPALELGRSFICLEYQKKHASLALVWRGIGEFIVRNPQYRTLFGPVSITDAYHQISKNLMVHFFREHSFDRKLSRLVRARKPPKAHKRLDGISLKNIAESLKSIDSVSAIVSGFEDDAKGIPILLRHYLKLNGALLSFNVDPAFSDVIDGLIMVDLRKTDSKILQRYMGKAGYDSFMRYHEAGETVV